LSGSGLDATAAPATLGGVTAIETFGWCALAVAILMGALWLASIRRRDVSIIDPFWGLGFVVVAWVAAFVTDGNPGRRVLLVILTSVWGLRLFAYLLWRNRGKPEDFRYAAMREHHGPRFVWVSLGTVFALQGVLMLIVSLPVQMGQVPAGPGLGPLALAGTLAWLCGIAFESIGDLQLARFRADPSNRGQVLSTGLWRYTRHPNYFGDFLVWWGLWLIAAETGWGLLTFPGPLVMSILLIRVSGVGLLERDIAERRPGYSDYVRRTSPFFPRPPRG
jgi:steroid 5-alpha reductase family enzyme